MDTSQRPNPPGIAKPLLLGIPLVLGGLYIFYVIIRVATQEYVVAEGVPYDIQTTFKDVRLRYGTQEFETFSFKIGDKTIRHEPSQPSYEEVVRIVSQRRPIKVWAMIPVVPISGDALPLKKLQVDNAVLDVSGSPAQNAGLAAFGILIALSCLGGGIAQFWPLWKYYRQQPASGA